MVGRTVDTQRARAMHGLVRNLVKNDLIGLSTGFAKVLVISGVGYKAELKGKSLVLNLGYSTPIEYPIPEGIAIEVEAGTRVTVRGADRARVGQVRLRDPVVPRPRSPTRARASATTPSASGARSARAGSSRLRGQTT